MSVCWSHRCPVEEQVSQDQARKDIEPQLTSTNGLYEEDNSQMEVAEAEDFNEGDHTAIRGELITTVQDPLSVSQAWAQHYSFPYKFEDMW